MILRAVKRDLWTIYEVCNDDGSSPLLEWLGDLNEKYSGSVRRLFTILEQVARTPSGPTQLPDNISHFANQNHKIYQFVAGDIRLFWFYSSRDNKVILCGCQHLKHGAKADKERVAKIIDLKNRYESEFSCGKIIYQEK